MRVALRAIAIYALTIAVGMSVTGAAQGTTSASARTEIAFLGTAGGPPLRLERSEPSTLLIVDGRMYLIDCGIGAMRRMLRAGIQSEQIRTIFFTHLHADHDLGLADVMANDFFRQSVEGRTEAINIYGPPQTTELVEAAFHFITVGFRPFDNLPPPTNGSYRSPFVAHEFDRDGVIFQDDKIRVSAAENSHYALMPALTGAGPSAATHPSGLRPPGAPGSPRVPLLLARHGAPGPHAGAAPRLGQFKSFSYRIETPHGVIVFTGDTGPSEAVERLARGADVLVAEANNGDPRDVAKVTAAMAARSHWSAAQAQAFRAHFEVEHLDTHEIGQLAAKARVKTVLLYHYVPENKADQSNYVAGVRTSYSGPVFAPDDLDRFCLGAGGLARCPR